jgi:hypothetical protein
MQSWNQRGLSFSTTQSKTKALDILTAEISGGIGDIVIRGRVKYTLLGPWYNIYWGGYSVHDKMRVKCV